MLVADMSFSAVRGRLRNPPNAVRDLGIDLKRKVIPINNIDIEQDVPITPLDAAFGPVLPSLDDLAFGPIVHPWVSVRSYRIDDIQRVVAAKFNVSRLDILSARRTHNVVLPRQVAMYLARTLTTRSLPEIGRRFGGRDHSTAHHAIHKIERLRGENELLNGQILDLIDMITCTEHRFS